ncbi:MAG TPA: sigma-70 family RNA polymerase sigma factor [Anaeromyxobacteraceae bacterium]|nr:sigma-70 family RNA polymerase sigma factor [Anaeromyxobacteraceae bacterium]
MHRAHARYAPDPAPSTDGALLETHALLIERVARRLAARTAGAVSADDLWSAGALGLLDAARRYEAGRDVRFETFVEHRVRGAMLDELRRLDHLPRRLRADLDALERSRARLSQQLGREPELDELAESSGLAAEQLHALAGLDAPHTTDLGELVAMIPTADDAAVRAETLRAVAAAVGALPERLQLVLGLHYDEGLTYREIAKMLDVSEPRVCQLHGDAMKRLRAALADAPNAA